MSNNQMVSVPRGTVENAAELLQEYNKCSIARDLRAILAQPAEQHHVEPAWYMIESGLSVMHAKAKAESEQNGWDTSAYCIPLYTRPAKAEPVAYILTPPGCVAALVHSVDLTYRSEHAVPLYTHADPAEVERLRVERRKMGGALVACANERDALRAQLAEAHALLREVGESGFMVDGQIMPSNEALELQDRVDAALSASAEESAPVERDALKPCPFCGCKVTFLTGREDYRIAGKHGRTCPFVDVDVVVDSWEAWQARAALALKS